MTSEILGRAVLLAASLAGVAPAAAQSAAPLADVETLGTGTRGTAGAPRLAVLGLPAVGDPGPGLALRDGRPGAAAVLLVGLGLGGVPLPAYGATVWPAPPLVRIPLLLDGNGHAAPVHSGPAAASADLLGLTVFVQGVVVDPAAQGGRAFTAGKALRFGAGFAAGNVYADDYIHLHDLGQVSHAIVFADLDGNGRTDAVTSVGKSHYAGVRVVRRLADGSQAPPWGLSVPTPMNAQILDLAAGDLDGDGDVDVVARHAAVEFLRGLGDGSLAPPVTLGAGGPTLSIAIAVGEITGDGVDDLAVAYTTPPTLALYAGGPQGPAAVPVASVPLPDEPYLRALQLADLDQDGLLDVLVVVGGSAPTADVAVVRSLGGGALSAPATHPTGLPLPSCLATGDVDGDGRTDAVVGTTKLNLPHALVILPGDGAGGLGAPVAVPTQQGVVVRAVELADLDGDGRDEALLLTTIGGWGSLPLKWLLNPGGALEGPLVPTSEVAARVVLTDVDADGSLEVGLLRSFYDATGDAWIRWWTPRPDGTPPPLRRLEGFAPKRTRTADLDGDGRLDLVGDAEGGLQVVLAEGPMFGAPVHHAAPGPVKDLVVTDLDEDGRLDVVAACSSAGVAFYRGLGAGDLAPPVVHAIGNTKTVRVADVDLDGLPDVVAGLYGWSSIQVLPALGGGALGAPVLSASGTWSCWHLDVADLDGDGRVDVVVQGDDAFHVLLGTGTLAFAAPVTVPTTSGADAEYLPLRLADLDGDGDPDLVRYGGTMGLQIWLNDGDGVLTLSQSVSDYEFDELAVADVNLDGAVDILCNGVLLGYGDGTFAPRLPGGAAGAVGDFDGDGDLDTTEHGVLHLNRLY